MWEKCHFKSTFEPKQGKLFTLNRKTKEIVTLNYPVSQIWKTMLL